MYNSAKAGTYRPIRQFHINKAIPVKQFKEELDARDKSQN